MVTLDWLTCIANTFQLLPETQLTIVYLFDRYLMVHRFTVDKVLLSLNYEIGEPRAIHFVRRFTKHFELGVHQLAKAICEIAAYDYNICHVKPSMIAFASVYLAAALKKIEFPEQLYTTAKFSKTKVEKLVPTLANAVVDMLKNQKQYPHIYKKMLVHRELIFSANNIAALTAAANASRPHEEY
ncbi:unnamed protein product [Gongylonema pulchrum]|uniref:Cyclin_C domain-containing protein n=1 Tax=Gongylonema pulchrum TaxID=637853 RepID=A0A183DN20_9BILA|nr:unnamed protein product [Gongylonema pulchrum]